MTYSIPAQCQQVPYPCPVCGATLTPCRCQQEPQPPYKSLTDEWRESYIAAIKALHAAAWVPVMPPDNCIPATARAILDLDKPKLNDRQRDQADGVARAIGKLNSGEHRYGFMVGR